jgi:hypothetical protein
MEIRTKMIGKNALSRIFRHKGEKVTGMGEWDQNGSFGDWLGGCRVDPVGSG